jgi:pimeloyl-ACP methyl ester carboxylesterase
MRGCGRRIVGLLVAGVVAAAAIAAAPSASAGPAPPRRGAAAPSAIEWRRCFNNIAPGIQCGAVEVPLDYGDPSGRRFDIAMARLPATDPANRIGTLFLNPGGPGGSGVEIVVAIAELELFGESVFDPEVRARFDLVGFDPRGIMRSKPLQCFRDPSEWPFAVIPPLTPEEEAAVEAADRVLADACEEEGGRIQDHMSTANVARDMDVLRQAVGDAGLNFVGYSYGSFLGTMYANLFPANVRALVVDGVLDPIAWTTGLPGQENLPFSTRLRSDAGAQATLDEFLRLCDEGGPNCAFAPDSSDRFDALADRLRAGPIEIVDPETGEVFPFTYQDLINNALGAMYDSASWPFFAEFLAFIESFADPVTLGLALADLHRALGIGGLSRNWPRYPNFIEGFPGVACSDSDNPDTYQAWSDAGAAADDEFGYFGRLWTWVSSTCAVWTGFDDDRYMGPFTADTANPVLIVGTRFDPATRYEGAVTLAGLLPNSSLLTVDGWGHTSLFISSCSDAAIADYLVDLVTPAPGTVCPPDVIPFADSPAPAAATTADQPATAGVRPAPVPGRY